MENRVANHILRGFLVSILLIGGSCVSGYSQIALPSFDTDFQLWNETQFIVPLTKKKDWNFIFSVVGRFGNNVSTVTDARVGGVISKKINKYVTLSGGYLYQYSNPTFIRKRYGSRFYGTATFTVPLGKKFTLVNRDQVQYEDRYSRPNSFVLRPRIWIKREVTIGKIVIEPFFSWEPFYDTLVKKVVRHREQVGFSHKFSPKFSVDFYYVRQDETLIHTPAGTLNGIGTNFKVTVR